MRDKTSVITVRHNAEMSHRLPILPGKCQNLHGHSWDFKFYIESPVDENGITLNYGDVKKIVRGFIDEYWDHGTALGINDPLVDALDKDPHHQKTYLFGQKHTHSEGWPWPTVEAFAHVAAKHIQQLLIEEGYTSAVKVLMVEVEETSTNTAIWERPR